MAAIMDLVFLPENLKKRQGGGSKKGRSLPGFQKGREHFLSK
jgi:hypothetical protein